ncbi:hypothetical protein [Pectobacterium versatile]|uniref:hypothetical protein n=1 Tax=Pectobacterium versatile TaxID=2488639 RepID=UPI001CCCE2C7|nr:hypothetical protein [Pectobacterium versatile]
MAPVVPIPAELLIDCIVPEIPLQMTFGDSVELNERLLTCAAFVKSKNHETLIRQYVREP